MENNFQRKNSKSNASEGKKFELHVLDFFNTKHNLKLQENAKVDIGISTSVSKKLKAFDLGRPGEIVVECKSHNWTEGKNAPSAKMSTWNEAMYLFSLVPKGHRKIFAVEKFHSQKRNQTLAQYYLQTHGHLIPDDVEIWEFETETNTALRLK